MQSVPFAVFTTKQLELGKQATVRVGNNKPANTSKFNRSDFLETLKKVTSHSVREQNEAHVQRHVDNLPNADKVSNSDKAAKSIKPGNSSKATVTGQEANKQAAVKPESVDREEKQVVSSKETTGDNQATSRTSSNGLTDVQNTAEAEGQSGPPDKEIDATKQSVATELLQIIELLQMLGLTDLKTESGETPNLAVLSLGGGDSGESRKVLTFGDLMNSLAANGDTGKVLAQQLKQILQQLGRQLEQSGQSSSDVNELPTMEQNQMEQNQMQQNTETSTAPLVSKDFMSKLAEVISKYIQGSSRDETPGSAEDVQQAKLAAVEFSIKETGQNKDSRELTSPSVQGQGKPEEQTREVQTPLNSHSSHNRQETKLQQPSTNTQQPNTNTQQPEMNAKQTADQSNMKTREMAVAENSKPDAVASDKTAASGENANAINVTGNSTVAEKANVNQPQGEFQLQIQQSAVQTPGNQNPVQGFRAPEQPTNVPRMTQVIFGQVAQKAKLLLSPGASEMQIQLKPDFLGRLNLSIHSENGVVTAKFNAESYRVKEVIEANLNTLKDALAQQGVKVDQLVVNVGSQKDFSAYKEQNTPFYQNNSGKGNNSGQSVSDDGYEKLFPTELESNRIREFYGSNVDFTA